MSGYKTQIGGNHYTKLKIQPMQYSMENGLDPLQHTIIKYVSRHKDKGGAEDIKKAIHCCEMILEAQYNEGDWIKGEQMKTKLYTHKRKGGRYRIHFVAKGSGTLNTTGDDTFVVYHNEIGQHFVRPLAEFGETMDEVKKPLETEAWQGNWPESADARIDIIGANGNDGEHYYELDMSDPKNWREGDFVVSTNTAVDQFTESRVYTVFDVSNLSGDWMVKITADDRGLPNGWGVDNFKWHSRPTSA